MKTFICLLLLAAIVLPGCSSQKYGCPATSYNKKDLQRSNRKAGKQMRLF
ncbi:hypothetical protein [Chitinophaga qingshengii]|uniref:Lipoprotein n=1 Tax=Chitinophaga qingshengii TaxID=1569794 RepID=A0ABR7TP87_9BACT|nr:hypothetical protein [Chitinophaga qingshengii]MBC9931331.1 hypothetical protein [Chitinophaga qingshengii]